MQTNCPECGSRKFLNSNGEVSCRKCGFVITESIIVSS
ncbi:MAG: TFIIB-type zinc ribbon-containing protein [Methanosarcinales archaeon]